MTKPKKKALGSGLDELIPTFSEEAEDEGIETESVNPEEFYGKPLEVKIQDIVNNPDQPRKNFTHDELTKLVNSIKENGILEPLIVFKTDKGYQLVAGHRRLMAAQIANFETVPVVIRERGGQETENLELALIENIIRQDLNPIEEAEALDKLEKQYKKEATSIAKLVGKDFTTVKNSIRLLKLPEPVQQDIREGTLSAGHGKVLLSLEDQPEDLMTCRREIINRSLTVRQAEALTKRYSNKVKRKRNIRENVERSAFFDSLSKTISDALYGVKVEIYHKGRKKQLIINYQSMENLEHILKKLDITIQS
jgi:ParB family chromosome partitioning protein